MLNVVAALVLGVVCLNVSERSTASLLPGEGYTVLSDIEYASAGGQSLRLDLYQPSGRTGNMPVVVFIHGGAFTSGDKSTAKKFVPFLTAEGYAVASVNYRLSPGSMFPAQIHDVKGAVRFLRANAAKYHLDADNFAVMGTSAGGVLASLLGVSCGEAELEGNVGGNNNYSSCVQATIDCFGSYSEENMNKVGFTDERKKHLEQLFGCDLEKEECIEKMRLMAAENHITKDDSPFLILHGEQDTRVPLQNSIDFQKKLSAGGVPAELITDPDYGHSGQIVIAHQKEVLKFLNSYLK
jgi:acetyl esterase/lipase